MSVHLRKVIGMFSVVAVMIGGNAAGVDAQPTQLQRDANVAAVEIDLREPDGVALVVLPNGKWELFGYGTAAYGADGNVEEATRNARLDAQQNVAQFLLQAVAEPESVAEAARYNQAMRASIQPLSDRLLQSVANTLTRFSNDVENKLLTLETERFDLDLLEGGSVAVTVGVSSEMLESRGRSPQPGF